MEQNARQRLEMQSCSVIVTRADGTVEDYGDVAYWHRNPLRRLAWRVTTWWRAVCGRRARIVPPQP